MIGIVQISIGLDKHNFERYCKYFLTHQFEHVLGAQKNRLIERVLLSTHNIYFGYEIRKLLFGYTLVTKVLYILMGYRWKFSNNYVASGPEDCIYHSKQCRP